MDGSTPASAIARILAMGRETFIQESAALREVGDSLGDGFVAAVRALLDCDGRVLVTGSTIAELFEPAIEPRPSQPE